MYIKNDGQKSQIYLRLVDGCLRQECDHLCMQLEIMHAKLVAIRFTYLLASSSVKHKVVMFGVVGGIV